MNILRPAGVSEGDDLPVGLWIHGGGYSEGGINDDRYNGSWMVQRSVEMDKPIVSYSPKEASAHSAPSVVLTPALSPSFVAPLAWRSSPIPAMPRSCTSRSPTASTPSGF
jgi:hypothetical protein